MSNRTYHSAAHHSKGGVTVSLLIALSALLLSWGLATNGEGNSQQAQQCFPANPTVQVQLDNNSVLSGGNLTLTVTVTNNNGDGCPASTFVIAGTFPLDGFVQIPDRVRLTLAPGESGSRRVIVKVPGGACAGPTFIRVTATNESISGYSAFTDTQFEIAPTMPDCGRAAPTVTVGPFSQLASSGEQLTFLVTVTNNDNPRCGGSEFIVSPMLPAGLTAHTPKTFRLFVPAGGSASRRVTVRADLFAFGDLAFTETATHSCATCLVGVATGTFRVNNTLFPQHRVVTLNDSQTAGLLRLASKIEPIGPASVQHSRTQEGFTVKTSSQLLRLEIPQSSTTVTGGGLQVVVAAVSCSSSCAPVVITPGGSGGCGVGNGCNATKGGECTEPACPSGCTSFNCVRISTALLTDDIFSRLERF